MRTGPWRALGLPGLRATVRDASRCPRLRSWFKEFDLNGNGELERDELSQLLLFLHPENSPTLNTPQHEALLDMLIERATSVDSYSLQLRGTKHGTVSRMAAEKTVQRYDAFIRQKATLDDIFEKHDADHVRHTPLPHATAVAAPAAPCLPAPPCCPLAAALPTRRPLPSPRARHVAVGQPRPRRGAQHDERDNHQNIRVRAHHSYRGRRRVLDDNLRRGRYTRSLARHALPCRVRRLLAGAGGGGAATWAKAAGQREGEGRSRLWSQRLSPPSFFYLSGDTNTVTREELLPALALWKELAQQKDIKEQELLKARSTMKRMDSINSGINHVKLGSRRASRGMSGLLSLGGGAKNAEHASQACVIL